ncbi:MAG: MFS transporter [Rhodospirillales bacterium]|nr:MFS transporter [Rhodospirillales bacterium]
MNITPFLFVSPRFLAFGFFAAFFSSFGQTYFIALSSADIRDAFGLSHGDFGLIYSCATLASAGLLIWAGRKIDDIDLRPYTSVVCAGLALACLGMASVGGAIWLVPVIFALRFTGQGLLSHISTVSMARYFDSHRGKALSIASMGYPLGEALFPTLAVALIATVGWRQMWAGIGFVLLVALVPFMLWLLKGHGERQTKLEEHTRTAGARMELSGWTRAQVLGDVRFYIMLPSFLALSFIGTGFFFHQVHLTESKGWSLSVFASFFVIYAISQTLSALLTGILVDRFDARKMMRFYLLPTVIGLGFIAFLDAPWTGAAFMAFMGLSAGSVGVVHGAIWAETYGIAHLGAIKAMGTALMVLSTALSPPIMGLAIDAGLSIEVIALYCTAYIIFAAGLVAFVLPRINPKTPPG